MAVLMGAAHAETVVAVVANAEANVGENRDSDGGVDSDGGRNIGIGGGGGNGGQGRQRQLKQGQRWQRW